MAGEYNKSHEYETKAEEGGPVETQDRGLFDFLGKKKEEEKPIHQEQEEVIATEFEKVKVSEAEPAYVDYSKPAEHGYHHEEHKEEEVEKKHETLSEKLRRSDSSSSSSSDEEGDDEEKRQKRKERKEKKGLTEKIKEKISGDKEEEKKHGYEQDTEIPVEKFHEEHGHPYEHGPVVHHHEEPKVEPTAVYGEDEKKEDEKKGFLEKIKDKLPGHKKPEDGPVVSPPPPEYENVEPAHHEGEVKEKKGLLEKIKEKIPGYHPKTEEEKEKEKEKEKPTGSY